MALQLRPNCEYCDKDLPPNATDARICSYECTFCADCVENKLHNVCPNCGGGFVPRPIRPATEWRPGVCVDEASAVGQARASEIQPRGCRRAFGAAEGYSAAGAVNYLVIVDSRASEAKPIHARSNARRSMVWIASSLALLAMTERASLRRHDRPLDLAEADAVAVALAPAAHHQRIAVFEERALHAAGAVRPARCRSS